MAPRGREKCLNLPSVDARKPADQRVPPTKETHEMVENENYVDENEFNRQIGKDLLSRCSSTYFRKVMNKFEPKLSEKQRARIKSTPFSKWLKMPKLSFYRTRVDVVLKRFDNESLSFFFGKDIVAPFTSFEFSLVLGLPHAGQQVDLNLRTKSIFLSRFFSGKLSNATRRKISENLLLLAELDDDSQLDDFIRMFILFAFNCVVFPKSSYLTPRFIFSYIDDLPNFFEYSWGNAAYRFLCNKIAAHMVESEGTIEGTTYLDGCVVGLMAWVYEKVPSLGVSLGSPRTFPRLFKWSASKIPMKTKDAEALLKKITRTKVLNITPFGKELELFGESHGSDRVSSKMKKEETCKIRRLERLVEDQRHEIQRLKQICCQTYVVMEKEIVSGLADGKPDEDKNDGKNVPVVDEVEDFDKDLGGYNERWGVNIVADFKGDGAAFTKLNVEENKISSNDSSREVVDESDDASGIAGSGEDMVNSVISSIVKNVMTRTDRVKKRKLVTPPSSTPRCKTKSAYQDKDFTIISDEENNSIDESDDEDELALSTYKGREDFCGSKEVSNEDRKIIMDYLTQEKIGGVVWEGERIQLFGHQLCDLLFGSRVRGDVINCYMQIVSGYSRKNGFDILCMDTTVQDEVLNALERANKKRMLKDDAYIDFLSKLTNDSRRNIEELNKNSIERCRFLMFPINRKNHWFLLVYKTEEKKFELRNSMHTSQALGTARAYANFLTGYMRVLFYYDIAAEPIKRVNCRQQGADLDCGVYTCLWLECYSRDDDEAWNHEKDCTINSVRARIASTILSDRNGVFTYALNDRSLKSISCLVEMQEDNCVRPDAITMINLLPSCSKLGTLRHGKAIHGYAVKNGFLPHLVLETALIDMSGKCGGVTWAEWLFLHMKENNLISWNAIMAAFLQNGRFRKAIELLFKLRTEPFILDQMTFASILPAYAEVALLREGKQIHGLITKLGFSSNTFICNALIHMYTKGGDLISSQNVFDGKCCKDVISRNTIIMAYEIHGFGANSIRLFSEMMKDGYNKPNGSTFVSLLTACSIGGNVNEGQKYFDLMKRDYDIDPGIEHYGCVLDLLDLLCRLGNLDLAKRFIDEMPVKPTPRIWGSLLSASRHHQNIEMAELCAEHILSLNNNNAGCYVLLSNMYADVGKWDDVEHVRCLMEKEGLEKTIGRSTVERHAKAHVFTNHDRSQAESNIVYNVLDILLRRIGEDSHVYGPSKFKPPELIKRRAGSPTFHGVRLAICIGLISSSVGNPVLVKKEHKNM